MNNIKYSAIIILILTNGEAFSDDNITFTDIAKNIDTGIFYKRAKSDRDSVMDNFKLDGAVLLPTDVPFTPFHSRGNPGVGIFDFDNDGDQDIYVTNGPNVANSLYSNQLTETGKLQFEDVAIHSNVDAQEQDSVGVCFGDIDNDGDEDLYVLGASQSNRLFENLGNTTFKDITLSSQTAAGERSSMTCSFGDVNNDGLLDLVVANNTNHFSRVAPMIPGFQDLAEHNQLFVNQGNNIFTDQSKASGVESFLGLSFSIALVDYDMDGDADIVVADDQGPRPPAEAGGNDYGYVRLLKNNGYGVFEDVTEISGTNIPGGWMGLAFGDLNNDNKIDIFSTNVGDYLIDTVGGGAGLPTDRNFWSSRWFLGQDDGGFIVPEIGNPGTTPFGWGTSIADYNNDGDLDIIYYGGEDMGMFMEATNPGVILKNDGAANFNRDEKAFEGSTNHSRRSVNGVAVADLNNDGFTDIVSVSNTDWPDDYPLVRISETYLGGQFDDAAYIWPLFRPVDPLDPAKGFVWNGHEPVDGSLSVEINNAKSHNRSAQVQLLGTKGLLSSGSVNRDGIGAVVSFKTRKHNRSVIQPVVSGGSYSSANSHIQIFGMGNSESGVVDVLWPGGVRNRFYNLAANEKIVLPEIPCSYEDTSLSPNEYVGCVRNALDELRETKLFSKKFLARLLSSSIRAYFNK